MQLKGICESCNKVDLLLDHHWFNNGEEYHANICSNCNGKLIPSNFGLNGNHNLPDWETQKQFIAQRLIIDSKIKRICKRNSNITKPLSNCRIPVTKETYDTITYLRDQTSRDCTYDTILRTLTDCYIRIHKLQLPRKEDK